MQRLVCDRTLPHCKKCGKNGRECPGYNDHKPVQWVANGVVTSRRRKKGDSANELHSEQGSEPPQPATTTFAFGTVRNKTRGDNHWDLLIREQQPSDSSKGEGGNTIKDILRIIGFRTTHGVKIMEGVFAIGGKSKLEEVVATKDHAKASAMIKSSQEPLKALASIVALLHTEQVPNYTLLSEETSEVVQAVSYCESSAVHISRSGILLSITGNQRAFPVMQKTGELVPNPIVIAFPMHVLHLLPPAIHHILVCLSLNHYLQSLPASADRSIVAVNRSKSYKHRGAAIRYLSRYVGTDKTQCNDMTIMSILLFLTMEVRMKRRCLPSCLIR